MRDIATLEAYGGFRQEAAELGIRHFLEVFNPNAPAGVRREAGRRIRQRLDRPAGWPGSPKRERPLFLKIAYNGADALARTRRHDRP